MEKILLLILLINFVFIREYCGKKYKPLKAFFVGLSAALSLIFGVVVIRAISADIGLIDTIDYKLLFAIAFALVTGGACYIKSHEESVNTE